MENEILTQVQEVYWVSYKVNLKRNMPQNILIKLTKIKTQRKKYLKHQEKQQIIYKGIPMRLTWTYTKLAGQKEWQDTFKAIKVKPTSKIILSGKDLIQIWRWNQNFMDNQ